MINLKNISKSFGDNQVLKNVSVSIPVGKTTVIIGNSGSGKSTLLRSINGLVKIDSGEILYQGKTITTKNDFMDLRKEVSMVFQNFNLFSNMSVFENISYPLKAHYNYTKNEIKDKVEYLLNKIQLTEKINSYPHNLSGGQKQRVAIARGLAINPKAILFDEPTSALDPLMVKEVLDLIKKLKEEGLTSLIVTHEMDFAKEVADEVIFMKDGIIIEQGNSKTLFNSPKTKELKTFISKIS
ncbi:peptide ABC transporter ATP-binding protein [Candidatus Izimaplasma bacterium ZiA1]|uniref:amino acid ABC transporter ATP-binding protein n=1 Tax=Candidatus Izimoplasma sp. ZiA1 TaxID=2024899 RepID=UPI000BAA5134|nr:peptide ABC transporter ATP-binding protein [Candidatus Izimaplasma bacterium ZiA1]